MSIPKKIHFAVLLDRGKAEIREMDMPALGPDDVLLKMQICNMCTMDHQQWSGKRDHQGFPYAGGHEYSGIIVAKGDNVIARYQEGDLVAAMYPSCGKCPACRVGLTQECEVNRRKRELGPQKDANGYYGSLYGFADYKVVDQRQIIKMNPKLSPIEAAFLEPLSSVCQCNRRANLKMNDDVVVIGAGSQGLNHAQVAHSYRARVIVSEMLPDKIQRAKNLGFADVIDAKSADPVEEVKKLTGGKGADVVIMAVGNSQAAYDQGYKMLKRMGAKFMLYAAGFPSPRLDLECNEVHYRNLEIYGSIGMDLQDWLKAAELLNGGLVDVKNSLEGKTFALRDVEKAYEAAAVPGAYRVSVDLQNV